MKYVLLLATLVIVPRAQDKGTARVRTLPPAIADDIPSLREFEVADQDFTWELKLVKDGAKVAEYQLTYPSPVKTDIAENNTVWAHFWLPKDDQKKRPAVVLLHWLGGNFAPLELVGRRFAERGIASMMIYLPHYGRRAAKDAEKREKMISPDFEETLSSFKQAVLDVRRAGDWLAARPDIDRFRIGLMGISLGSLVGSLVAGVDPKFTRVVLVIGGGDLAAICFNDAKETRRIKRKLEGDGTTPDQLREKLRAVEPLTYARRADPSSILMINAENDEVIPRACTEKLWEAFGKPKISWYKSSHALIVLALDSILKDAADHLKARPVF